MKVIFQAFLLFSIALITTGCNHDYGISNSSTHEVQQMIDEQETGFVVITNESDAPFLDEVQKALLEKREKALQFNVFRNDGENKNTDGLSKNPFRTDMPHVNAIYYIKDGTVYDEFDLEIYEGIQQQEELAHFLKMKSNSKGDSNE